MNENQATRYAAVDNSDVKNMCRYILTNEVPAGVNNMREYAFNVLMDIMESTQNPDANSVIFSTPTLGKMIFSLDKWDNEVYPALIVAANAADTPEATSMKIRAIRTLRNATEKNAEGKTILGLREAKYSVEEYIEGNFRIKSMYSPHLDTDKAWNENM